MFQHALFTVPNFSEGYCTDDNARAFILAVLLDELEEEPDRMRTLATTYARVPASRVRSQNEPLS